MNPWILTGLVVLALPVAIHLLMRSRPRQMAFPALRFVSQSHAASSGMLRLKRLLLLALRMATLGLFVLILARPMSTRHVVAAPDRLERVPGAVVLCFDNSPSMGYRDRGHTRLEAARRLARGIAERMSRGSRFAVIDLTAAGRIQSLDADNRSVLQAIDRVALCDLSSPVSGMLRNAESLLEPASEGRREIYLFTDMSLLAWRDVPAGAFTRSTQVPVYVLDVGVEENLNLALDGPRLSSRHLSRNATVDITTTVIGGARPERRTLALEIGGEMRGRRPVDLTAPWQSELVTFPEALSQEGCVQGAVRLVEDDVLSADNVRYFTLQVGQPPAVAVVRSEERPARLADDAYLVSMALAPELLRLRGLASVEPVLMPASALARQPLRRFEAVILVDAAGISPAGWAALERFVADGGGLIVVLGQDVADELRGGRSTYRSQAARALLGTDVDGVQEVPAGTHFEVPSYEAPALAAFEDGHNADLTVPVVRRYVAMQPGSGTSVILTLTSGAPALVASEFKGGTAFTLATGPQRAWSDLAARSDEFVVLMHSLLGAARHEFVRGADRVIGVPVTFSFPRECAGRNVTLTGPGLLGPEARQVNPTTATAMFPQLSRAGNYRLHVAMPGGARLFGFSLNLDSDESRLERRPPGSLAGLFAPGMVHVASDLEGLQKAETLVRRGRELTAYLFPILMVVLVLELLLANRFHRRPPAAVPGA